MKPTPRFQLTRERSAKAMLDGAAHLRIDAYAFSAGVEVTYEISGSIKAADPLQVIADLLGQLRDNQAREQREEEGDSFPGCDCDCDD